MSGQMEPTQPIASYDLFGQPLVTPGEIVPMASSAPTRKSRTTAAETTAKPTAETSNVGTNNVDATAAEEQRQRLLAQCRRLRASHRCPGRCVVTGELREGGLAVFRRFVNGEA